MECLFRHFFFFSFPFSLRLRSPFPPNLSHSSSRLNHNHSDNRTIHTIFAVFTFYPPCLSPMSKTGAAAYPEVKLVFSLSFPLLLVSPHTFFSVPFLPFSPPSCFSTTGAAAHPGVRQGRTGRRAPWDPLPGRTKNSGRDGGRRAQEKKEDSEHGGIHEGGRKDENCF